MPRPITVPQGAPGIATYKLSGHDEFTVRAVTFSLVPLSGAGGDNFAYLDMRDPNDGIILLQQLSPGDGANMFYSVAVDASEFAGVPSGQPWFPQTTDGSGYIYITQKLSPQTLYANCTLNVYKTEGSEQPPTDPITNVSPHYLIPDLHLWVEDVVSDPFRGVTVATPILLGVGS